MKDTGELIAAVAAIALRTRANLADGRISWVEILGYAKEVPTLRKGLEGIQHVPAELLDIDDAEADSLSVDVHSLLLQWGVTHRAGDITRELIAAAAEIVQRVVRILNLPPRAEAVLEPGA